MLLPNNLWIQFTRPAKEGQTILYPRRAVMDSWAFHSCENLPISSATSDWETS